MRRQQHLRHRRDFDAVYRSGRSYAQGPLVLRTRANPDVAAPRFGFAVGKRLGGAVVRNRIKRRLREAVKASGARGSVDVVVIARNGADDESFQDLRTVLDSLLRRADLLNGDNR